MGAPPPRTTQDVTARDRFACFMLGHDTPEPDDPEEDGYRFCPRCQHTVPMDLDGMAYGALHDYPPKHRPDEESGENLHR